MTQNPPTKKPKLSEPVLRLLHAAYKYDADHLHGKVGDLIDSVLDFGDGGADMDECLMWDNLLKLHNCMGLMMPSTILSSNAVLPYAVGFVLTHFLPSGG